MQSGAGRMPVRLIWVPPLLLLAALIAARVVGPHEPYDLPTFRLLISFVFYTLVSLGTLFVIGRNFLASGTPGLLLLECGVILWSLAGTVGDAVYGGDPNINVTIFNTCILLSGLCHLAGAVFAVAPRRQLGRPLIWLVLASALTLGVLWLVTHATLAGWLPVFFIPERGGTAVRYGVLTTAIAAFVFSAAVLHAGQRTARLPFTSWYVPAMVSLSVGLFGVMVQLTFGSVVNWLARVAQWLGGIYLLLAAVAALRESQVSVIPLATPRRPPLFGVAMAVVVVLAAAAIRLVFLDALGTRSPFVTFHPAVLLVALYGGWRAGLLATLLAAALADYFWMLPTGFGINQPGDWLALAVFATSSAIVSLAAGTIQRAQSRVRLAETRVQVAMARQRDLEALRLSEEKFVKAFHGNTAVMAITRLRDGVFVDVNQRWVETNGYARADVLGRSSPHLNIWKRAEDREAFVRDLERCGTIHNRELAFVRNGGAEWIGLVSAQVCELDGDPAVISSILDISERKQAEQALREANRQLADADRRKNEFLAVLSHELRNPLAPIRNSITILERTVPGSEQAARALAVIDRQATQLVRLVDDLLDVTRITRNKIQLRRERLDLNELVCRAVEDQRSLYQASELALELAAAPASVWVDADPHRIAQVVGNLLQNAAKFTSRGGRVRVTLSTETDSSRAVIRVTDNGVGIAPDMLGRLFTAFVQAEATIDRSKGGLGLGLALAKGLVELHGGEVSATSAGLGQGAEFVVRLPLVAGPPGCASERAEDAPTQEQPG
jgi:PAS domain S-box-containing protein